MRGRKSKEIIIGCATDQGTVRIKNQDRIVCYAGSIAQGAIALSCVCDGIGSYEYSEIASEIVTGGISLWFQSIADRRLGNLTEEELTEDLCETLHELNEIVWERRKKEQFDMGCTMSALLVINHNFYIFHVGDSRIYLVGDSMSQLTRDEVVYMEDRGNIRKKLSNYMGRNKKLWLNRLSGSTVSGDTLLLGSDGLFNKVDEAHTGKDICQKTHRIFTDTQAQKFCEELIQRVEQLGERDNISCGLIKHR